MKSAEKTGLINLRLKGLQKAGCMDVLLDHCQLLNFQKIRAAQLSLGTLSQSSKAERKEDNVQGHEAPGVMWAICSCTITGGSWCTYVLVPLTA